MTVLEEITHLAEIGMDVNVELDRVVMTIRDILALDSGSVIKTSCAAGENIQILIGGVPLGSGEIVIIEDKVGVRITDFREEA
jgi:flagellar motor switch protein FliN/FliY